MNEGLEAIIAEMEKPRGGQRIEVHCPNCTWHAWGYESDLADDSTVESSRLWLLAQHTCKESDNG